MNKGIFKSIRIDMIVIISGVDKVGVYYYLPPCSLFHHVPPCSPWWISISALHWAFIDMLVARFAVARVGAIIV